MPYVHQVVRKQGDGTKKLHWYRRGLRGPLQGSPGSPEFMAALIAAERRLAAGKQVIQNRAPLEGSRSAGLERAVLRPERTRLLSLDDVSDTSPLRLSVAAALAFPGGSMSPSDLRREAARGRLVIERVAGKDFTTRAAIERMRQLCRVEAKVPDFGSVRPVGMDSAAVPTPQSGSFGTESIKRAQAAALTDLEGAERKLAAYIAGKHVAAATKSVRDPREIPIADVIALYAKIIAPSHARPKETVQRLNRLLRFFGDKMLGEINGDLCRAYAKSRSTDASARKELEDLRAAINFHRKEGYCEKIVSVVLPPRRPSRDVWLTRDEVARLMWTAWRYREVQKGKKTDRSSRRHVAKFILVARYTGTRAGAVCAAALQPTAGHGWIDVERGVFYRRPRGRRETKKRQPPVPLPSKLLAHLRRWKQKGQRFCVEWQREPVRDVDHAFRRNAKKAGVQATPHTMRHTAATWLMQEGADPWQAAEYLGMTLKTLLDHYGHHHPDYLQGPRNVFDRAPQERHRMAPTKREQTSPNTINIRG